MFKEIIFNFLISLLIQPAFYLKKNRIKLAKRNSFNESSSGRRWSAAALGGRRSLVKGPSIQSFEFKALVKKLREREKKVELEDVSR